MAKSSFNLNTGLYTIFADSVTTPVLRSKNGVIDCLN